MSGDIDLRHVHGTGLRGLTERSMRVGGGTIQEDYPCAYAGCSKLFDTQQVFITHSALHHSAAPYDCAQDDCGQCFTKLGDQLQHEQVEHLRSLRGLCSRTSPSGRDALEHVLDEHENITRFEVSDAIYWPYPIDPNHTEYNFELAGIQITHPINGQTTHFYVSKLAAKIGTERINTKFSQVAKKAFLQSSAGTFATAGLEGTGAKAT
ncbi:hypothetical protein LTR92_001361 [Exophiala xenobiotica]|nr:hypothetical protein LTR92_001361 [Exophiala xenobiotica]KAK5279653.1 hypothetical protein LTR40_007483 [Exophiala xenobiotica]KAK5393691.1 hypothetical protein LTR79_008634 [Exophiala xenobiotica]KAK5414869.1 hypothetical protein LTR90_005915 [Exophiala xenobiotica]KAK5525452.1 hypothetical protein LTR07_001142 [Exophiala xenobiotica]